MTEDDFCIVSGALSAAETEIHNPGAARASDIDLLNLLEQAKRVLRAAKHDSYNGWSTYESWLVALWLDNDELSQTVARELATESASDMEAGNAIKADVENTCGVNDTEAGMISDLVGAALARVDWREIGAHFRAE